MTTLTLPRRRFLLVVAGLSLSALAGRRPRTSRLVPSPPPAPTPHLTPPSPKRIRFGVDALLDHPALLRNHRVGLITNQTGRSSDGQRTVDLLYARTDLRLLALFSPEHGFSGDAAPGASVGNGRDTQTGLPIYSLYGATKQPTPAMLADLDMLIYDLQDVGARSYTYIWTMALAMQAAATHQLRFVVLDRPDPVGGALVQGNVLDPQFASFVGLYPVPMRYGMTPGELARYLNSEEGIHTDLIVVPLLGWRRTLYYDQTSLPWMPPSPNMPDVDSATHYPGLSLFEGTNLSVGRGTTRAFQQIGAPWLEAATLAQRLAAYQLPSVRFEAVTFTPARPSDGKYSAQPVRGVRFSATDHAMYDPTRAALAALIETQRLHADRLTWSPSHFDALAGTDRLREQVMAGMPLAAIIHGWDAALAAFTRRRAQYLLYP
jgi:uncharacterized protein YbbC (DUF1343 family)